MKFFILIIDLNYFWFILELKVIPKNRKRIEFLLKDKLLRKWIINLPEILSFFLSKKKIWCILELTKKKNFILKLKVFYFKINQIILNENHFDLPNYT